MHSRIFQISKTPIHKDDYIDESRYYDHWFLDSIAAYVDDDTDRAEDIEDLEYCYGAHGISFGVDKGGEYFIVEDKVKYFKSNFKRFQEALNELSTVTLEDFASGGCSMQIYRLKEAYDDKFGYYVDGDEVYLKTFDEFIRYSNNGSKYYIGATIDYHN